MREHSNKSAWTALGQAKELIQAIENALDDGRHNAAVATALDSACGSLGEALSLLRDDGTLGESGGSEGAVSQQESSTKASPSASAHSQASTTANAAAVRLTTNSPLLTSDDQWELGILGVSAILIDLDGTVYTPHGLIHGADDFYAFLLRRQIPHVFLSNTGAKGSAGVRNKLMSSGGLFFSQQPPPLSRILTAAEAQASYMAATIPAGSRVFAISGGSDPSFWFDLVRSADPDLVASWDVRTHLDESTAKQWAVAAAAHAHDQPKVFVVLFSDGAISGSVDPQTGELGFADWSFDFIKKAGYLVSHGGHLVVTADDAFNPSADPDYPGHTFPLPGPGMFMAMFRKLMEPLAVQNLHVCGKGGREGEEFMMGRAIEMLRAQGHSGERSSILIVGDRFDTDIRAGVRAGIRSCLVESGCHA